MPAPRTHRRQASHTVQWLRLVFLTLALSYSVSASDRVRFKTWNTENGLPQNTVAKIVQTADGYLWCATFDGLARFDGARFKIFRTSNTPALPMNRLYDLRVDSSGRLWIWTEDRNTVVLYERGKFRAFIKGVDFDADYIYTFDLDAGDLRFPSGNEQYVFTKGNFERRPAPPIVDRPRVFTETGSNMTWINADTGYYAVSESKSTFYRKDGALPFDRTK